MKARDEGKLAQEMLEALYPFNLSIVGEGNDKFVERIKDYMDFEVLEFPSGSSLLGWTIPTAWKLNHCSIYANGNLLPLDYTSPFIVSKNSKSVSTEVSWEELNKHLCVPDRWQEDALPYDWRNLYRDTSQQEWSISMTRTQYNSLDKSARFNLKIESEFVPGTMKVLVSESCSVEQPKTVMVNAHNCHPYQANDDISGIVALLLLRRRLKEHKISNLNVVCVIAPELFGPLFYLDHLRSLEKDKVFNGALLFKAIGNNSDLKVQQAFDQNSRFNRAARKAFFDYLDAPENIYPFRELYGNDEIVLECPPFEIPSVTLTRFPFPTYHTSADVPETIDVSRIIECVNLAEKIITTFASNSSYQWTREGLPKLNTAFHSLYKPAAMPGMSSQSFNPKANGDHNSWNTLMNSLPSLISRGADTITISEKFKLNYEEVYDYLEQWIEAGHIRRLSEDV